MIRNAICPCALVGVAVLAPAAHAGFINTQPFEVESINLGNLDNPGAARGIGVFFTQAFQSPQGNNYPPDPGLIGKVQDLEFDSYVSFGGTPTDGMGGEGIAPPSTPPGFSSNAGFFEQPGTIGGGLSFDGKAPGFSEVNPASGRESFFFGRVTVPAETSVTGSIEANIVGEGVIGLSIEAFDPDEPQIPFANRGFSEFNLRAVAQRTQRNVLLTPIVGGSQQGQLFDVVDLYIEFVPAPGAGAALLAAGGLGASRRRR